MIVPSFWGEGRVRQRIQGRQVTLRRFGWSDESQAAADAHGQARAEAALAALLAGEKPSVRDFKVAYNGAQGLPIREEVLERHGENVITRNSYGARCLNVPDTVFADVDFADVRPPGASRLSWLLVWACALSVGWFLGQAGQEGCSSSRLLWLLALVPLLAYGTLRRLLERVCFPPKPVQVQQRLLKFLARHPDWSVRSYLTPAGMRFLVTHQRFSPQAPVVAEFFEALGVDRLYRSMCQRQACFRARLTGKPWRMGMESRLRPRPGVWPVKDCHLAARARWVAAYEALGQRFAACQFVETLGQRVIADDVKALVSLHDQLSGALTGKPLA